MNNDQIYSILRSCIIGSAYEACGVGFDRDEGLDVYHLDNFHENVDPEGVKGLYHSPVDFLETLCETNASRIYETLYLMEPCWNLGICCFHKRWQKPIAKKLWDMAKDEATHHVSEYGEEHESREMMEKGNTLFG